MNYLTLCQAFVREGAMSGLTSFTTTVGATGQAGRVTACINRNLDMRTEHPLPTVKAL